MREIKFRAWDKLGKKMERVYAIDFNDAFGWDVCITLNNYRKFAEVELMQFTGLKDKNGKEIYEGDIVNYTMFDDGERVEKHVIQWQEDRDVIGWSLLPGDENVEVIGNKWENPELLEEK